MTPEETLAAILKRLRDAKRDPQEVFAEEMERERQGEMERITKEAAKAAREASTKK
jgi:hypothetical protein